MALPVFSPLYKSTSAQPPPPPQGSELEYEPQALAQLPQFVQLRLNTELHRFTSQAISNIIHQPPLPPAQASVQVVWFHRPEPPQAQFAIYRNLMSHRFTIAGDIVNHQSPGQVVLDVPPPYQAVSVPQPPDFPVAEPVIILGRLHSPLVPVVAAPT